MERDSAIGPQVRHLKDYRPPDFLVDEVDLTFDLNESATRVLARLVMRRNPAASEPPTALHLDGEDLTLISLAIDGEPVSQDRYQLTEDGLILFDPPEAPILDIETEIAPDKNTALQGLYVSNGNFFTQCEAEGFRRITYFPDRPDVMATYRTRIIADKQAFPVLLSNGNQTASGDDRADTARHWVEWHDPFPKPSYLFALVASQLDVLTDSFKTQSGRSIKLQIFAEAQDLDKCDHAMASLKRAMAWDEKVYGLEYDLDLFMIVAVSDFNMGAMENKGLNIFNTKCVLAKPETATDTDYEWIESVVAHEYFHNWTGNRVTCRDWFQLSLKEGLTVFRDQQFSADYGDADAVRIDNVRGLRASQFPEDSGPLAHPVRPESYIEINNFYTSTIYNKGAELIRMMHRILGPADYRKGIDLYFERHDGQAVTVEDFVAAMEDATGTDLRQFRTWYSQAGTPHLSVEETYDQEAKTLRLTVTQSTPPTPAQKEKKPLHIPLAIGLIGSDGAEVPVQLAGDNTAVPAPTTRLLQIDQPSQEIVLTGLDEKPALSLLRGFSAPVILTEQPIDRLKTQLAHDSDPFARWEAGQQLATRLILDMAEAPQTGDPGTLDPDFTAAIRATLMDEGLNTQIIAKTITLPSLSYLGDQMAVIDFEALDAARSRVLTNLADALGPLLTEKYESLALDGPYRYDPADIGCRALRNRALAILSMASDPATALDMAARQVEMATNMTDRMAGLAVLNDHDDPRREEALERYYKTWKDDPLVIDKWFSLQAQTRLPDAMNRVKTLMDHPAFTLSNPNRARSLISGFATGNPLRFNAKNGTGYRFLADCIAQIDPMNPQMAARMIAPLGRWHRFPDPQADAMKTALERILASDTVSRDTFEIASKSLNRG
ncbi:MAG: aminopeptidase N [Pseudomonadota bacterium]